MQEQRSSASFVSAELPTPGVAALRSAVADLVSRPDDPAPLRAAVCTMAREARARSLTPERLLVCFKAVWAEEAVANPMPDRRLQSELFNEMVSLCIHEYFA